MVGGYIIYSELFASRRLEVEDRLFTQALWEARVAGVRCFHRNDSVLHPR